MAAAKRGKTRAGKLYFSQSQSIAIVDVKGVYELNPRRPSIFNVKLFSIIFSAAIKQDRLP